MVKVISSDGIWGAMNVWIIQFQWRCLLTGICFYKFLLKKISFSNVWVCYALLIQVLQLQQTAAHTAQMRLECTEGRKTRRGLDRLSFGCPVGSGRILGPGYIALCTSWIALDVVFLVCPPTSKSKCCQKLSKKLQIGILVHDSQTTTTTVIVWIRCLKWVETAVGKTVQLELSCASDYKCTFWPQSTDGLLTA